MSVQRMRILSQNLFGAHLYLCISFFNDLPKDPSSVHDSVEIFLRQCLGNGIALNLNEISVPIRCKYDSLPDERRLSTNLQLSQVVNDIRQATCLLLIEKSAAEVTGFGCYLLLRVTKRRTQPAFRGSRLFEKRDQTKKATGRIISMKKTLSG